MKKLNANSYNIPNTNRILQVVLFILSVTIANVNGWCSCQPLDREWNYREGCNNNSVGYFCNSTLNATICGRSCRFTPTGSASNYYCSDVTIALAPNVTCSDYNQTIRFTGVVCTSQHEADSAGCVMQGNVWQNDSCKINHCTASDSSWLSTSIAACTGSNNYAIINTDSTCEHVGTCCPNDSIPSGNTCKWRCDSVLTQCNGRAGALFGAVLPDTSVSGQDTTFSYQCFYNCAYSPNPDSTVYIVEGNTVLAGPSDSIADGIKSEWFSSIRSTTGSIYVYDYLSPSASEYVDSIAAMKCVEHLWRCVINNKYVYWYDNQEVPAGCTNIVRVK